MHVNRRAVLHGLWLALGLATAAPAWALRVTTWNLLDYNLTNVAGRSANLRTVFAALQTDVLIVQEIKDSPSVDSLLINVLRVTQPGRVWKLAGFIAGTESALYYDSLQVSVSNLSSIATSGPRDVLVALVRLNGYRPIAANQFRIYSVHFKAGNPSSSPADSTTRRAECNDLRNVLNAAPAGTHLLMGGDTNFYGAWEGGYLRLTESQLDNDGRLQDPLVMPGTWNTNGSYALYDTQCPCLSGCPVGFSGGGLDDRFDLFLGSASLFDGQGLDVLPGGLPSGYGAFGNDGQHFNTDIDAGGFNLQVPIAVASALRVTSDHLPAIVTLQVPAHALSLSQLAFGDVLVDAAATELLPVANSAVPPADALDYSLAAPAGFTAPGGTFVAIAGAPAGMHAIGVDTGSPGVRAGVLTLASDDPDTSAKSIQLSATVLAHARASLDSTSDVLAGVLDLGAHDAATFRDSSVRVHNAGWNALQARLSLENASFTGGDGRFSLVPAFTPSLLAGTGRTFVVRFDPAGATPDSTYEATLTLTAADEPLPGATAQGPVVVTVRARRLGDTNAAPGQIAGLGFAPPRPNPVGGSTQFVFSLPAPADVSLSVFDPAGRRVATVAQGRQGEGTHSLRWSPLDGEGQRLAAGLYFVRFATTGYRQIQRLVVLP